MGRRGHRMTLVTLCPNSPPCFAPVLACQRDASASSGPRGATGFDLAPVRCIAGFMRCREFGAFWKRSVTSVTDDTAGPFPW